MKQRLIRLFVALGLLTPLLAAAPVRAATIESVMLPNAANIEMNNLVGIEGDAAPGFETGSFASNGIAKSEMHFYPELVFGRQVTVGEISKISYWTKKSTDHVVSAGDWYMNIYTKQYTGDPSPAGWYGARINTEPYFAVNLNETANDWNNWTTDGATNQLRFYDSTSGYFGSYTDPVLSDFKTGSDGSGTPYATQPILRFTVATGSGWAAGFTGQVDGLEITLTDGTIARVNFEANEPVPAPTNLRWMDGANVVACDGTTSATLIAPTWDAVDGAVSYNYQFKRPGGTDWENGANYTATTTGNTSFGSVEGDEGVWQFRVNAVGQNGNVSEWSNPCAVTFQKAPVEPEMPTNKEQCKKDGWKVFGVFKNQGDCVSYVATKGKNKPALANSASLRF